MIVLQGAQLQRIVEHARRAYPEEACGFLLGRVEGDRRDVARVRAATNARREQRRTRYTIPARETYEVWREAQREGLEIVGFYHSHPDAPARPSEYDRKHAWPWYVYLIVPLRRGRPGAPTAWRLDEARCFQEVPLRVEPVPRRARAERSWAEG